MTTPRALAMQRLREKEELARQAAILGANKRKGIMSSLPTNLGSIGQFISDDNNNLDNLSYSTNNGLKVNLQNNRNKESGEPKVRLEDMDFSNLGSVGVNVHPRVTAMNQHRDTSAISSFIETNSALNQSGGFMSNRNPGRNIDQSVLLDNPGDILDETNSQQKDYIRNKWMPWLGGAEQTLDPYGQTKLDLATHKREKGEEEARLAEEEALRKQGHEDNYQRFLELKTLYPNQGLTSQYFPDVNYSSEDTLNRIKEANTKSLSDEFDWWNPLDWTWGMGEGHEEEIGDLTEDEIEEVNEANYKKLEMMEDSLIIGDLQDRENQAIIDANQLEYEKAAFPDPSEITELSDVPEMSDIPNAEDLGLVDVAETELNLEDNAPELYGINQSMSGLNPFEDTGGNTFTQMDDQLEAEEIGDSTEIVEVPEIEGVAEGVAEDVAEEVPVNIVNPFEDTGGNVLSEIPEVAEVQIAEEEVDTNSAAEELVTTSAESNEAKTVVDDVVTDLNTGKIDQEEAESTVSNAFDWLKDIFGVDNKSLLRAFVKYVGGRLFGLSSGKAAAFAWQGIEQDMALEAAKGAEARKYADNMAVYEDMYDKAMAAGNTEEAERILSKMRSESGMDKTDPEKYYEGLDFLQKKKAEAIAAGNDELVKGIDAQIKRWEAGGVDGSTPDPSYYDLRVQDGDGRRTTLVARDGINGREVKDENDQWIPWKEWTDPTGELGPLISNWKTNKSDAEPETFRLDKRVERAEDALDAEYNDGKGDMSEEEYNEKRNNIIDYNTNIHGVPYEDRIPGAINVSPNGLVTFPPMTESERKLSLHLATGVRGLQKVEAIFDDPRARERVGEFSSWWSTNMAFGQMEPSQWKALIRRKVGNPLQQMYYIGILELTMARLRKDTGAAYNQQELFQTMELSPGYQDISEGVTLAKIGGLKSDLYAAAGFVSSGQYQIGILEGLYRPNDADAEMMNSVYNAIDDDASYKPLKNAPQGDTNINNKDYETLYIREQ